MTWRQLSGLGSMLVLVVLVGCDYSAKNRTPLPRDITEGPLPSMGAGPRQGFIEDSSSEKPKGDDPEVVKRREIILGNVLKLMQTAYKNPGGRNFELATENLNELFGQTFASGDYSIPPITKDFLGRKVYELSGQDPEPFVKALASSKFTIRDARHIEDCMLYHAVAAWVAGEGDDLTRVRRIFRWIVRNVQLVPAESLAIPGGRQAQARPADVLMRGMATEQGDWSERGWLFMALCRQINVDAGLLTYTVPRPMMMMDNNQPQAPTTWIVAAVVDNKAYLFDQRIGLEVPNASGDGVATLDEAIDDPEILQSLDLPGQSNLGTSAGRLANSPSKIGILIDSSVGYLSPRMRLLQGLLIGENRMVLFRDPVDQAKNFKQAMGARYGGSYLWSLPIQIEDLLFTKPEFVTATLAALQFFDRRYPLLYGRTAQLRGDLDEAINRYVSLRFAENPVTTDAKEEPIPPEVQRALDVYATCFLAQCQLDKGNVDQAEYLYGKMLDLVSEPGPGHYYYYMLRWTALYNLGLIREGKGDARGAIAYFTQGETFGNIPTAQKHGNLLRSRRLAWDRPIDEPIAPLPPAPPDPADRDRPGVSGAGERGPDGLASSANVKP